MIHSLSTKISALTLLVSSITLSAAAPAQALPAEVSAYEQYSDLIQVIYCPEDNQSYGPYDNYGYWGGSAWCGQSGEDGYWVWEYPNWYVWDTQN